MSGRTVDYWRKKKANRKCFFRWGIFSIHISFFFFIFIWFLFIKFSFYLNEVVAGDCSPSRGHCCVWMKKKTWLHGYSRHIAFTQMHWILKVFDAFSICHILSLDENCDNTHTHTQLQQEENWSSFTSDFGWFVCLFACRALHICSFRLVSPMHFLRWPFFDLFYWFHFALLPSSQLTSALKEP